MFFLKVAFALMLSADSCPRARGQPDTLAEGDACPCRKSFAAPRSPASVLSAKGDYTTVASDVDRSNRVPDVSCFPDLNFPALRRGKLDNGVEAMPVWR